MHMGKTKIISCPPEERTMVDLLGKSVSEFSVLPCPLPVRAERTSGFAAESVLPQMLFCASRRRNPC